jgi:hypothetical protein
MLERGTLIEKECEIEREE